MALKFGLGAELSMIQVRLKNQEVVWFEPANGLSAIYGLNGTGKSTIINALKNLFNENRDIKAEIDRANTENVRGFIEFSMPIWGLDWICRLAHNYEYFIDTGKYLSSAVYFESAISRDTNFRKNGFNFSKKDSRHFSNAVYSPEVYGGEASRIEFWNKFENECNEFKVNSIVVPEMRDIFFMDELLYSNSFRRLDEIGRLFDALRENTIFTYGHTPLSGITTVDANEILKAFSVGFEFAEDTFDDRAFPNTSWSEILKLEVFALAKEIYDGLTSRLSDCGFIERDDFYEEYADDVVLADLIPNAYAFFGRILKAVFDDLAIPTFWFEPNNLKNTSSKFSLGIAVGKVNQSESSDNTNHEILRGMLQQLQTDCNLDSDYGRALTYLVVNCEFVGGILEGRGADLDNFHSYLSNPHYVSIGTFAGCAFLDDLPFRTIDLDANVNLDKVAQQTVKNVINESARWSLMFSFEGDEKEFDLDASLLGELQIRVDRITVFLQSLEIGISRCVIDISKDLVDWIDGIPATVKFFTEGNHPSPISIHGLSSAQQYWVNAAFLLFGESSDEKTNIILADEPEKSLHTRAIIRVLDALVKFGDSSVIATHSTIVFRLPDARLLHLERGHDGYSRLGEPWLGDDIENAAKRLGTSTFELFSFKRAFVVVEGAHDVAIVEGLASLSFNGRLADKLLIVPARGIKNVATVADSVVVTDFTVLHVLIILDNGRTAALQEIVRRARESLDSGASATQTITQSGLHEFSKDATFEERVTLDLIQRAIHRRMLHRLHFFALPTRDIVDLLPVSSFGLTKSWEELRAEHHRQSRGKSFKEWLKEEYQVSISTKTVKKAFDSLDNIDGPLKDLLDELEVVASLSSLDINQ